MTVTESPNRGPEPTTSTWTSTPVLLAIGFLALVAVLGAVLLLNRSDTPPPATGAGTPTPSVAASTPARPLETTVPISPPAGVRWELYNTVALPYSETAGPRTVTGDVARGYAHTPSGALIAAAQIAVRYRTSNDWRPVVEAGIAPGQGRQAWITIRSKIKTWDPITPGMLGQTAGFKFVDYTPARAVIQFVSRFSSGDLQMVTSTVTWDGQDWRLVLQADGSESPSAQKLGSLAGFIPWGGV